MENIKKVKFKDLIKITNMIGLIYLKANSHIKIGKEDQETILFTLNETTTSYKVTPTQMVDYIENALNSLDKMQRKIIANEVLHIEHEPPYWYLEYFSRSTYFRYRKAAYYKFVSFFI